jgi:hypothetical protein
VQNVVGRLMARYERIYCTCCGQLWDAFVYAGEEYKCPLCKYKELRQEGYSELWSMIRAH